MFEVGEYIIYGRSGVCKIEKVGSLDIVSIEKGKIYYTLVPVYTKESKIFTPVDNQKIIMRRVISKEKAINLIENIKDTDLLWVEDDKKREGIYKEALRKCDCKQLIKIIKTLYLRKQSRIEEGKKVLSGDEKYFNMAEENLYGELAISLDMDIDKIKNFVIERLDISKKEF